MSSICICWISACTSCNPSHMFYKPWFQVFSKCGFIIIKLLILSSLVTLLYSVLLIRWLPIKCIAWRNSSYRLQPLEGLMKNWINKKWFSKMRKLWSDPIKEMNEYMKKCVSICSFPFSQWLFIRTRTPTRICYSYGTLGDEVSSWNLHEMSKPLEISGQQISMKVWVSLTTVQFWMKNFQ